MSEEVHVLAERVEGTVQVHDRTAAARWEWTDLAAADGHALRCIFTCRVRALAQDHERRMLAETILAAAARAGVAQVQQHFDPRLRAAAAQAVQAHEAAHWLTPEAQAELRGVLERAAAAVAFASGLEVLAPFELMVESPTLTRHRTEALQRRQLEDRAERRRRAAERAAAAIAAANGSPPAIDAADEEDRRDYLCAMIDAAAARAPAATLCAVSGNALLVADPAAPAAIRSIALPAELGPLRSVERIELDGRPRLLVGAQMGLMLVDPASPAEARLLRDPQLKSSLGFSQCLRLGDQVWACHGDAGIVTWDLSAREAPARATRTEAIRAAIGADAKSSPRRLCVLDDGRLLFAMGSMLCTIDRAHNLARVDGADPGEVIAILPWPTQLQIVRRNGTTGVRSRPELRVERMLTGPGPLGAAAALPCFDLPMRLVADERGIQCIDDTGLRIREFSSGHRDLRLIAATAKWIAALSSDRQRAILWQTTAPGRPQLELHLGARTRHRVADLCWL